MKQFMMYNRIKVLLLAFALLFAGLCFSISGAYAHYENEVSQQTIYGNKDGVYSWGFLENTTQVAPSDLTVPALENADAVEGEEAQEMVTSITEVDNTVTVLKYPSEDGVTLLKISYPEGCDTAILQYNGSNFETGTIYSFDGVQGMKLGAAGAIELSAEQGKGLLLQIPGSGTIDIYFYSNGMIHSHGASLVEIISNTTPSWSAVVKETQPILGAGGSLTWTMLGGNKTISYEAMMQYLLKEGYVDIEANEINYPLTISQNTSENTITVSNPETQNALAGTYRMRITYKQKLSDTQTISMQTLEVPFFVNYR